MKILLVSDFAGKVPIIPQDHLEGVDFVLLAGDITLGAKHLSSIQRGFAEASKLFPDPTRVFYIPGNHDSPIVAQVQPWVPSNFTLMHDRSITFNVSVFSRDILIIGFGGAKLGLYNNFAFSEEAIQDALFNLFQDVAEERLRGNLFTILLVHDPPFNTQLDFNAQQQHVGSESVRRAIETFQPDLAVSGHIHESPGIEMIGKTKCVNAGEAKYGKHAVIAVDGEEIHVELY
ncbi:MAG TPA: metallophosphoesterase [Candidatus Lokiarchaeia archaeon]|nr:metallophosphoesterase [Candidatus Lokiarchaeia archaeon]